jgi:hypothetical protein
VTGGTISMGADGRLTFTPAAGYAGTPTLSYTIADGQGGTATSMVAIDVRAVPVPPVVTPPVAALPEPAPAPAPVSVVEPAAPSPAPTQSFAPPAEAAPKDGFAPGIDTTSLLLASLDAKPVFTDPNGYQMMVLPSSEEALVLFRGVPDQEFGTQDVVRFAVPMDAFAHTKSDETVTLNATLMDGTPLPGWLNFSGQRGLFEGVPPKGMQGEIVIKVVARDQHGREAAAMFRVRIGPEGATQAGLEGKLKVAKRATPASLADSRAALDIRGKAAKLVGKI